jgi:hypothetical protein
MWIASQGKTQIKGVIWRGMPDWSKLPEQQRWQIVTFLKLFKTSTMQGGKEGKQGF